MTKKIYFENLDGLRFLCFLSVFLFHSFHTDFDYIKATNTYHLVKKDIFGNGNIGVNFFFVLSGFLITFLLVEEKMLNGQIDIRKFWFRRILRIWPLFYLCVCIGFFVFPLLKSTFGQQPNETARLEYYITFINNFDFIVNGSDASVLSVLWSVAIEEQFYFVWPIILYLLPIKRYWIAFIVIILLSWGFRAFNNSYIAHEYHTLSCIGDMAIGAFGAWLAATNTKFKIKIEKLKTIYILLVYALFFSAVLFRDEILQSDNLLLSVFERTFIAIIILMIILEQNFSEQSIFKMSRFKLVSKLGSVSYGLYCLHFIGILVVTTLTRMFSVNTELWQVLVIDTILSLALSIFLSLVSYKLFELPFLRIKNRFAYITR
jgi:peptidoglycan/LPS O-acetylase OafA/YrhL